MFMTPMKGSLMMTHKGLRGQQSQRLPVSAVSISPFLFGLLADLWLITIMCSCVQWALVFTVSKLSVPDQDHLHQSIIFPYSLI